MKVNEHGADWLMLRLMIESEITALSNQLLEPLDIVETSQLRGRIGALKWLVQQVEPPKTPSAEAINYE